MLLGKIKCRIEVAILVFKFQMIPNILNEPELKLNSTISEILDKIPKLLEKFPIVFVSQENDHPDISEKKERFVAWMLHRLLQIKMTSANQAVVEDQKIDGIIVQIFDLISQDPLMFRLMYDKYMDFIESKSSTNTKFVMDTISLNVLVSRFSGSIRSPVSKSG